MAPSLHQVSAVDPDGGTNGQVVYEVIGSGSPFTVNRDTGVVTTTAALDYETQDRYTITVQVLTACGVCTSQCIYTKCVLPHTIPYLQACDEAVVRNCSEAEVVVNIEDFNDEIPLFDLSSYRTDVCSSTAANVTIMQVAATDRDSGSNAAVTYSITVSRAGEREGGRREREGGRGRGGGGRGGEGGGEGEGGGRERGGGRGEGGGEREGRGGGKMY